MLSFKEIHDKKITIPQFAATLTREDLKRLTNEMADTMLGLIETCKDADVTFVPSDPKSNDTFASNSEDVHLPWTLGHVIVHATASSEEAAAIAAELARGVEFHGRSRFETPWEQVKTIEECRNRLEESRRMRLASLEMWPLHPNLENDYEGWPNGPRLNAMSRFLMGLVHDDSHLEQIRDIVSQAHQTH